MTTAKPREAGSLAKHLYSKMNIRYNPMMVETNEHLPFREENFAPTLEPHTRGPRKSTYRLLGKPANQEFANIRQRLLSEIPQNREGIDMNRVESFVKKQGFTPVPCMVLDRKHMEAVREILATTPALRVHENQGGAYMPQLHLILVWRDPRYEALNSPVFTEGIIVHEQAHASSAQSVKAINGGARIGFVAREGKGHFLEEGFAEALAIEYRSEYLPTNVREKICTSLRIPMEKFETAIKKERTTMGFDYFFSGGSAFLDEKQEAFATKSMIAGETIRRLCKAHPELWELMQLSRIDPRAKHTVKKWFDRYGPDTWKNLQQAEYTPDSFAWTQKFIINRVMR